MRRWACGFVLLGALAAGCAANLAGKTTHPTSDESTSPGNDARANPIVIKTPEIVRVLEEEDIVSIATTHSQLIYISTRDGRQYEGVYVHAEDTKYPDTACGDILNLVSFIRAKRPPNETRGWSVICE